MNKLLATERGARITAALGALAIAFSAIFVRLSHSSPSTAAIFRCAYALPLLALLAFFEDRRFGRRTLLDRRAGLLAGIFFGADLVLWAHSIDDVGAGLATVLANIQVVAVPLAAWLLLSERPSRRLLSALPLAVVGVALISGVVDSHAAYGRNPVAGALFGAAAGIAYVGALLLLRHGGADLRRPAGPLFEMTLTATLTALAIGALWGPTRLIPTWASAGWLLLLALTSQVLGWLLITSSLPRLPAAVTSLLLMIQPVGSVFLGALILSERPSLVQLGGVVLVLAAVVFANSSRRELSETDRAPVPGSAAPRRARHR
jgi:drug/metabolite transporter (DMT)-like permease